MFRVRVQTLEEYKDTIEITSNMFHILNGVMHHSRKGCKNGLLLEEYHLKLKRAILTSESCFVFITFMHTNLPVSRKEIEIAKV